MPNIGGDWPGTDAAGRCNGLVLKHGVGDTPATVAMCTVICAPTNGCLPPRWGTKSVPRAGHYDQLSTKGTQWHLGALRRPWEAWL